ncbi:hypothetical protein AAFC00_002652 [Neodothiora populina]|uniref:ferric-chelate reductase (NADPH) n=1 Tax=Neodothiora populina TaxID=2781224 RepID=A0ABR3P827_9PEZI
MPSLVDLLARRAGMNINADSGVVQNMEGEEEAQDSPTGSAMSVVKRISIPYNSSSPPGLVEADTRDPWNKSAKYALGWVYFCIILLVLAAAIRVYHIWTDKIRLVLHKEQMSKAKETESPATDYEMSALGTDKSTFELFPRVQPPPEPPKVESSVSSSWIPKCAIAAMRFIFYRPIPALRWHKRIRPIVFPSLGALIIVTAAFIFVILYCFIPQPYYWQSIRFGSPPLAIRAGMIAVAMMPWIVGLSMKANVITMITGIHHERLNVLHRWLAYICLVLSLIHTVPFYITPVWDDGGLSVFRTIFPKNGQYIYGTGIACLVPLIFLCLHSLPPLRRGMYELFVSLHVPVSIIFLGMLFWHCKNFLTSWSYLWATTAIWIVSYAIRIFYLNWTNPWRMSWLIGEEAAVTLMPENALKITIPTQMRWKCGQYVYLRMPGISVFENHPFTIASLCSDDFPSAYGEGFRDMVLVFRPFGGFTKKVLNSALDHGPWHTYQAFLDGPYGGMTRSMDAFDHVVLFAGGSGITAVVSHLLNLIKRMRDGKALTKTVHVIWALKRPETMEWFKEELRICREYAPPDTVRCQFFITAAKRQPSTGNLVSAQTPSRPVSMIFHDKVNEAFQNIANNRYSMNSMARSSTYIVEEAGGDAEREKELRQENEDRIRPLPQAHLVPLAAAAAAGDVQHQQQRHHAHPTPIIHHPHLPPAHSPHPTLTVPPRLTLHEKRRSQALSLDLNATPTGSPQASPHDNNTNSTTNNQVLRDLRRAAEAEEQQHQTQETQNRQSTTTTTTTTTGGFDFGFPSTPTEFQKNLMRFAFLPATVKSSSRAGGWSTEYGRPDIPYMLRCMNRDEWGSSSRNPPHANNTSSGSSSSSDDKTSSSSPKPKQSKRVCVFVCGPSGMRVDVSNGVAALQRQVWDGDGGIDEVFLHAENYAI